MVKGGEELNFHLCSYCGAIAGTRDHVPPICCYPVHYQRTKTKKKQQFNLPWVWACSECNTLLGKTTFATISSRAELVAIRLSKRYKDILNFPYWTPVELAGVEFSLQSNILSSLAKQAEIKRRIATAKTIASPDYEENEDEQKVQIAMLDPEDLDL